MISSSALSTPFVGPKLTVRNSATTRTLPPPAPASAGIFRPPRISAAYAERTRPRTASHQHFPSMSPYEVLGIRMGATCHEIKTAYRRLARVVHPDTADRNDSSADDFIRVHAAYSILSDPQKRADYDRLLFRQRRTALSPLTGADMAGAAVSGLSRMRHRSWETDQCW